MKLCISSSLLLAGCLATPPVLFAQQPASNPAPPAQSAPAPNSRQPAQPAAGPAGNPFPEDTNNVPVMPSANAAAQPEAPVADSAPLVSLPAHDADPARSPDDADSTPSTEPATESTSSVPDIDRLRPRDDEDARHGEKGSDKTEHHETAADDIEVGNFELSRKNWKAALSRFQSAMVLDPENPEVFWGMAEASRHLGEFSIARGYYQLVYDYDPESRHGKDARKALKDPEIANAAPAKAPPARPQK